MPAISSSGVLNFPKVGLRYGKLNEVRATVAENKAKHEFF